MRSNDFHEAREVNFKGNHRECNEHKKLGGSLGKGMTDSDTQNLVRSDF